MIRAIPTKYRGIKFRSRVEARWAVFFDTLGIKWEYEMEGYDLDGVAYLPDFYLKDLDCFVEIKGDKPKLAEQEKAFALSKESGKVVHIFSGSVPTPGIETWNDCDFETFTFDASKPNNHLGNDLYLREIYALNQCPRCRKYGFSVRGIVSKLPCGCVKNGTSTMQSSMVERAYRAARSAQFEYRG